MNVKKVLIATALASLVATDAQAHGRWHGHHGGGFFWGAALGAALTLPFYYSRAWADPGPYYYYSPAPTVYLNPPVYLQSQPVYVQGQSNPAVATSQPRQAGAPRPANGVIELGPVSALPPASSNPAPISSPGNTRADQLFAYPSRGQSEQQAANDRYDCGRWATQQSGYDPELRVHRNPETGPVNYARALSACLEGRGYSVR